MEQFIRDNKGFLKGRIIYDTPSRGDKTLYDKVGKFWGKYLASFDKTYDRFGRFYGDGDQLISLLEVK